MTSVCIATYNGARFIKEQIDSILSQLSAGDELIISDDGSTDGTLNIINSYNDNRIKVLHHQKKGNRYYPKLKLCYSTNNFENTLKHSKGDYIFLSDQDDVWENSKMKNSLDLLKKYDFIIHNFSLIDESGNMIKEKYYEKQPMNFNILSDILSLPFWGCCICFNRKVMEKALPFPEKIPQHDSWIGLIAEKYGKCCWSDAPLIKHRLSSHNTSTGGRKSENSFLLKINYRLNILIELLKR